MRIRTIKPEFFTHEGLYELEIETELPIRVAFAGLWCAADKAGRFKWEPRRLGVAILPYDGIEFSRVLDALFSRGFLVRYRVEDVDYGMIPSFSRHQFLNNKERESVLPEPSPAKEPDATSTRKPRVDDACNREGKGKEERKDSAPTSPLFAETEFADEWSSFVKHRKQLKKPLTDRAVELTLMKLEERPQHAVLALQMAIQKGWQSIEWEWFDKNYKGHIPSQENPRQTVAFLPEAFKTPQEMLEERRAAELSGAN